MRRTMFDMWRSSSRGQYASNKLVCIKCRLTYRLQRFQMATFRGGVRSQLAQRGARRESRIKDKVWVVQARVVRSSCVRHEKRKFEQEIKILHTFCTSAPGGAPCFQIFGLEKLQKLSAHFGRLKGVCIGGGRC